MAIDPTAESALSAQRSVLLNKLGNSAQASAQQQARKATNQISDNTQNSRFNDAVRADKADKADQKPVDVRRGRRLNISI